MRKSNLLQPNSSSKPNNDVVYPCGDDEEEDPLDAYMREIEEQAGVKTSSIANGSRVAFTKGATLGNLD